MLNTSIEKWQSPLHYQWLAITEGKTSSTLNYSSGNALGFINLRGLLSDEAFVHAIATILDVELPNKPKQMVYADKAAILWQSPDEWLLICHYDIKDALLSALQAALSGVFSQVVDNSGGLMLMRIHGTDASLVLRHLTPYPIGHLVDGQCVQTIGKKTPFLIAQVALDDYALIFRRSFADYIWKVLEKTAKPYQHAVQKKWGFQNENWLRYTD